MILDQVFFSVNFLTWNISVQTFDVASQYFTKGSKLVRILQKEIFIYAQSYNTFLAFIKVPNSNKRAKPLKVL